MTEASHNPTDEELHEQLMEDLLLGIHVAMPGRIQSYDAEHQVADIIVGLKHSYPNPDGSGEYLHENYPVLPAVPVLFPRGDDTFLSFPMKAGTCVQLLFNSSAIGIWRRSTRVDDASMDGLQRALQGVSLVGDVGRHHLTHAVALLGLETYGRAIRHTQAANATVNDAEVRGIVLGYDSDEGTRALWKPDGVFAVEHGTRPVLHIDAEPPTPEEGPAPPPPDDPTYVALAPLVDALMASFKSRIASWAPTGTGDGASLKSWIAGWTPPGVAAKRVKAT